MDIATLRPILLVTLPLAAGYLARRRRWAGERFAERVMTVVVALGYPTGGFFAIWQMDLQPADFWLPALGTVQVVTMAVIGMALGRLVIRDAPDRGLVALGAALGNAGFTMGGLVLYHLHGAKGLGLMSIYCLMWTPLLIVLTYPIARHYAPHQPRRSLGRLMARSLFDWRSVGLPIVLAAIWLSLRDVAPPAAVERLPIVGVIVYAVTISAYFCIGLRLHLGHLRRAGRLIAAVAVSRFGIAAGVGCALAYGTLLTPWPLGALGRQVIVIEACVPVAVTMVGVANMFGVRPRTASLLFVINTLMYLTLVLPIILLVYA
ncbi:MAG: hypothetical protein KGY99_08985 [Phycisphaerae bacterium]|jgi:predicted permease|nr:hypothetical protein [Phycisphaerae bacterium]